MSRSPLLQRLMDACALVGDAERHSSSLEQELEEREMRRVSRRQFVGIAAAGVGLAACDRADRITTIRPQANRKVDSDARVVIVGAGLAGLTCAYRLQQSGVIATVYEASERLGGRCWTRRGDFADGQIAEHGGELIDQSHKEIRHLAQELGLPLDNVLRAEANGAEPFYYVLGEPYSYRDATRDIKQIWQKLHRDLSEAGYPTLYDRSTPRGAQLDGMSIAQWIDETVPGGRSSRLGRLLEVAYTIEYGAESTEQSALNLIYLLGFSGQGQLRMFGPSNEKYHVRGGNDLIVTRLADRLNATIITGAPLVAIQETATRGFELSFDGGAGSVRADKVVLTVPFSVLREEVDFSSANFRPLKETAIREFGMGANAKLNVQFVTRLWEQLGCGGDTFADTGYQATWDVSRAQAGGAGILVNYTGGDVARAQSGGTAHGLAVQFLSQVEPVLPGISGQWNGQATFDDWQANPWTRGSYSFWRVGQYTAFGGVEGEPEGNCHFAGEHTSIDFQGYLNGAVASGERAAAEVAAALRSHGKP